MSGRTPRSTFQTRAFRKAFYPATPDRDWNDWHWQARNRLRTLAQLEQVLVLSEEERAALSHGAMLPVSITPYYMSLVSRDDESQPLRRTVIPTVAELDHGVGEADDPLAEDGDSPIPGLVHRYPDRVLLLVTDFCSSYCRYCTRSRMVGHGAIAPAEARLEQAFDYIRRTPAIRDVLISGGDPLTLSTDKLEWLISSVRAIEHVDIVRIGTRVPVCLPMRIDDELTSMLKKYHPLYINTHFNHPKEVIDEARAACGRLADAGIPLGNQTVLLRGINSSPQVIERLNRLLLKSRVKPYYLFQGDPVTGTDHLRTPVSAGIEIMEHLRGRITGMGIPHLVIDAPGGGGKIPIGPNYVLAWGPDRVTLRNWEHKTVTYVEPEERDCTCTYDG